jgi:hypothetical protein
MLLMSRTKPYPDLAMKCGLNESYSFPARLDINLVQIQKWSFALEETPDFELDLV